jgi:organic radical activating enzyme
LLELSDCREDIVKLARLSDGPEIFFSVQGEGPSIGRPSVFVRCSLCNLHCVWCDTDYTWNWVGTEFRHVRDANPKYTKFEKRDEIVELAPGAVAELVMRHPCRNVVLTGGEPMIQQTECQDLMSALRAADPSYRFEVETNGTFVPQPAFHECIDQYNVSPKLGNSGVALPMREKEEALAFFVSVAANFKFVIQSQQDLDEVNTLVQRYGLSPDHVFLMPEGQTSAVVRERSVWLVEICKRHGYRFSDRLHLHLFGEGRGK